MNIFRAPVDNQHFKDTIDVGKPIDEVAKFLHADERLELEKFSKNGIVRYWGSIPGESNIRNFEKLQQGDEFLCYRSGHYIALCTIAFKLKNPELARHSWGETETGKTWELIYFFKDIYLFKIDSAKVNKEFGFSEGPVMGFSSINEKTTKDFISKYKSVKNLIDKLGAESSFESKIDEEVSRLTPKTPFEAQFYLADLGNNLEFDTFVPASDSGRSAFSKKLNEVITIHTESLREYVAPIIFDPLAHIDVIWFKDNYQPKYFFEVIHKTGWSEALLRLDLATKHYEMAKARIVGTKANKTEFDNVIRRWSGPKENILYRDYDQLVHVHSETLHNKYLVNEFLG